MVASSRLTFPLLPPEMRQNILRFLDSKSLLAACGVSKAWLRVISPASAIWRAASRNLGILISDAIEWSMCRDIFLRLGQRWRSIIKHYSFVTKHFLGYSDDAITAIYYHKGRLATSFQSGTISVWNCAKKQWMWLTDSFEYEVTCIKLDDRILIASYANGVITSRKAVGGMPIMAYYSPCTFTRTVDYLSEANLVFSAESRMVAWNMTNGRLVLAEDLKEQRASGLLVAPYPGEEGSIGTKIQKLLVASRTNQMVVLWEAISKVDTGDEMSVSVKIVYVIRVACLKKRPCLTPLGNQFHFDGRYLYFLKHSTSGCNWVLGKLDVTIGYMSADFVLNNPIKKLVGVGKKYMLVVVSTGIGEQMDVIEKESGKFLSRVQLCRRVELTAQLQTDLFCIGRRSWLDGFDGKNDVGQIYFYVTEPNSIHYLEWYDRKVEGYRQHHNSDSIRVGRRNRGRLHPSRRRNVCFQRRT